MKSITLKSTILFILVLSSAYAWTQDLYPVRKSGKYGYIDKSGNMKIQPRFENAFSFNEGLAKIKLNKNVGYINSSGKVVVTAKYKKGTEFNEGLAAVRDIEGNWTYIDKTGATKFKLDCSFAHHMHEGMA
ncbi:MAG: WG repeat-containing protein, partial [Flavobacteriales bacterium]|nr:WG repeat-containing protein [Flavobacteriales bacterium]